MSDQAFLYPSHEEMVRELAIAGRPLSNLVVEIQDLYRSDKRPWIIGFSGGKDSTTVLSLIYFALISLAPEERHKPIYVVSSDTLVETPVVEDMIHTVLEQINESASRDELPISGHAVSPAADRSFWVNLLGRGYPAPTTRFRWCTERMKIEPVSAFILDKVAKFGEAIVVLGSRRQESSTRAQVIAKHKIDGTSLGRHSSLPNAFTYMPIEDWHADDVWEYLLSAPCPWGGSNRLLFDLYKGSNQGECPLVIDKSTPSCGNSRFGCWTCTVVTQDKAIHGLIESGASWMLPLLKIRNYLWKTTQSENMARFRNHKRRTGMITFASSKAITETETTERRHVPGPYWMSYRQRWLKILLWTERRLRRQGHDIELIRRDELHMIRQQWLWDPNEPDWADSLPAIYAAIYPDDPIEWLQDDSGTFSASDQRVLSELQQEFGVPAELIMKLMEVEHSMSGLARRKGLLNKLRGILGRDWGSLDDVREDRAKLDQRSSYRRDIDEITKRYEALAP